MTIGEKLLTARKAAGLTQKDIADRLHVTKQTVFKYENGIITNIPLDKLYAISEILDVEFSYLMGLDIPQTNHKDKDCAWICDMLAEKPVLRKILEAAKIATDHELTTAATVLEALTNRWDDQRPRDK